MSGFLVLRIVAERAETLLLAAASRAPLKMRARDSAAPSNSASGVGFLHSGPRRCAPAAPLRAARCALRAGPYPRLQRRHENYEPTARPHSGSVRRNRKLPGRRVVVDPTRRRLRTGDT